MTTPDDELTPPDPRDEPGQEIVRVVTITFNPGPELEAMLDSLPAAADGVAYEVVIVDNGTDPQIVDAQAASRDLTLLRPGSNLGYGAAANEGIAGNSASWILVMNPDVVLRPGAIRELVAVGERYPRAGAIGPLILNVDGTPYPSARRLPRLFMGTAHAVLANVWPRNPLTKAYKGQTDEEHVTEWLSGACLLLRREAVADVKGFDPSYFMFFEDVDLGRRLGQHGWQSVFAPSAVVIHDQGRSWRDTPAPMLRAHHASAAQYLSSAYPRWWQAPLRGAIRGGLKARAAWQTRGK